MNAFCQHVLRCIVFLVLIFFISVAPSQATESDPFKNLDFDFSDLANNDDKKIDKKSVFPISGYVESRNQLRIKEMDKPISLRQRLWLDCYLGQDWIRGFANAYFDYDPAVRDWTDDKDELYYVDLNEAYLTIDTERIDFILGKKMMRWRIISHRPTRTHTDQYLADPS